jgi:hypothetical protein
MGDIMLLGVLRMPFDDHGDIHLIQLRQRCLTAAKRIEDDADRIAALEAKVRRLERRFPMLGGGPDIGWITAEKIYNELYKVLYPNGQTLERVAERGGFGWDEIEYMKKEILRRRDKMYSARKALKEE